MKVKFKVKYGLNVIDVPIPDRTSNPSFYKSDLTDFWDKKVTIYNDFTKSNANERCIERHVIDKCQIYGGSVEKMNGTVKNVVNSKTVITKDIEHYREPLEYINLTVEERQDVYTAQPGDFIVFSVVDDVVTTAQEFVQLQQKYKNNGFKVMSANANINHMTTDNITMANV